MCIRATSLRSRRTFVPSAAALRTFISSIFLSFSLIWETSSSVEFSRICFGGELDLWTHVGNVLAAMQAAAAALDLDGRLAAPVA